MTPVSSPTPDEQAAETGRTCQACGAPTYAHASDCRAVLLAQGSEMAEVVADLHAALVVVREQLTQAQAENSTLREDYARLLSRWDDEREARIRAEGPAARWCEMPRTHEPHLWTCDGETTLCPGYHPSPPTYTTEGPS